MGHSGSSSHQNKIYFYLVNPWIESFDRASSRRLFGETSLGLRACATELFGDGDGCMKFEWKLKKSWAFPYFHMFKHLKVTLKNAGGREISHLGGKKQLDEPRDRGNAVLGRKMWTMGDGSSWKMDSGHLRGQPACLMPFQWGLRPRDLHNFHAYALSSMSDNPVHQSTPAM